MALPFLCHGARQNVAASTCTAHAIKCSVGSATRTPEEKGAHWDNLAMLNRSMPRNNMKMIVGDANVRWGGRREAKRRNIFWENTYLEKEQKK